MARYSRVKRDHGFGPPSGGSRLSEQDIDPLLRLTESSDPIERQVALKNLCTCHVQADDDRVWAALLRMFNDEHPRVRREALHALTDSTPASRTQDVVHALERRYGGPDASLRRRIRRTLSHYRRTGALTDAPR